MAAGRGRRRGGRREQAAGRPVGQSVSRAPEWQGWGSEGLSRREELLAAGDATAPARCPAAGEAAGSLGTGFCRCTDTPCAGLHQPGSGRSSLEAAQPATGRSVSRAPRGRPRPRAEAQAGPRPRARGGADGPGQRSWSPSCKAQVWQWGSLEWCPAPARTGQASSADGGSR